MQSIVAMSKIATLRYKNKDIDIFIRERLGKHGAPYIVMIMPDSSEAHMTIEDQKIFDNSIKGAEAIAYVKEWVITHHAELLRSWEAAKTGKALKVPSDPKPKSESAFQVRKIKALTTTEDLIMHITYSDGEVRIVDFKKDVIPKNDALKVLQDPTVFKTAKAQNSAVIWESVDIDIEAADLYDISKPQPVAASFSEKIKSLTPPN